MTCFFIVLSYHYVFYLISGSNNYLSLAFLCSGRRYWQTFWICFLSFSIYNVYLSYMFCLIRIPVYLLNSENYINRAMVSNNNRHVKLRKPLHDFINKVQTSRLFVTKRYTSKFVKHLWMKFLFRFCIIFYLLNRQLIYKI